jgi:hypothetical protein
LEKRRAAHRTAFLHHPQLASTGRRKATVHHPSSDLGSVPNFEQHRESPVPASRQSATHIPLSIFQLRVIELSALLNIHFGALSYSVVEKRTRRSELGLFLQGL